ncbi:MAG: hypothetical protein Q9O24_08060 [Gammaproteobacteria bacterium]|nr:hypothetical protein [Gammaproteobacteria bacterium]
MITKNEMLRNMLLTCRKNQLKWRYVLADSWFSSSENMQFIHEKLKNKFILALKSNRLVALSLEDKKQGRFVRIDSLLWSEKPIQGWVKGLEFPVLLHRQVFTKKVELLHKNIKSNTALAKSPTKVVRTQSNHIFMSLYASARLETLSIQRKMSTFALKGQLYIKAIRVAFEELQALKVAAGA